MSIGNLTFAITADGVRLALRQLGPRDGVPVVLSHGSFSDHQTCAGLATYLAGMGFSCWLFDWRGRGESGASAVPVTFEAVAALDVPCVVTAVLAQSAYPKLFWVGHSGGGLVAAMWLARQPANADPKGPQDTRQAIAGLVMLATQATGAARGWRAWATLRLFALYLRCHKVANGKRLRVGPENEDALMMRQWCQWNLRRQACGTDGFDYLAAIAHLKLSVLGLAGVGDQLIAPVGGCESFVQAFAPAFGARDAKFQACGKAQGFSEDYSHNRIIRSKNAQKEIWPLVGRWLVERSGRC